LPAKGEAFVGRTAGWPVRSAGWPEVRRSQRHSAQGARRPGRHPISNKEYPVYAPLIPDRLDDFIKLYKNEKRKKTDFLTYTISDYMVGLQTTRGREVWVDRKAAFPTFKQQINILKAAEKMFEMLFI